jgi:hypothetical protein
MGPKAKKKTPPIDASGDKKRKATKKKTEECNLFR